MNLQEVTKFLNAFETLYPRAETLSWLEMNTATRDKLLRLIPHGQRIRDERSHFLEVDFAGVPLRIKDTLPYGVIRAYSVTKELLSEYHL